MKYNIIYLSFTLLLFLTSCSSEEDEILSPETFGTWSPSFVDQTTSFTQTRTGNQGSSESRTINVTSSSSSEETDEYVEGEDLNGDGDQVDDVTITTTIYTASENLGSYTSLTTEITENRSPSFFNTNNGFWYSEIFIDDNTSAGYVAFDIYLDNINLYTSTDGSCIEEVESEGDDSGDSFVVLNTENIYLSAVYDLNVPDLDPNFNFDVYTGWEKVTDSSGNPSIYYFISYYYSDEDYYTPSDEELENNIEEALTNFILDSDLYLAGTLALLDESDIPNICSSSSKNSSLSLLDNPELLRKMKIQLNNRKK